MFNKILILAPHTDDGEFGCGGTANKWLLEGKDIYYVAFSSARKSVPKGMPDDILEKEIKAATKVIGISQAHLILLDYPVREFSAFRQQILEDMIRLGAELEPDLVLLPSSDDTHQDHQTVSQEGFRAFKKTSMVGYEMPYNNLSFSTNMFVVLNKEQVQKKIEALQCYKSQAHKPYSNTDFIEGLARVRGTQIGVRYAEAFEVIRWVVK